MTLEQLKQRQSILEAEEGLLLQSIEQDQAHLDRVRAELDFIFDQYWTIKLDAQEVDTAMLDAMPGQRRRS